MTDSQFTRKLQQAAKASNKARDLYAECEQEYERRYGVNPSDADDDTWIDALISGSQCKENLTASEIESGATNYAKLRRINK